MAFPKREHFAEDEQMLSWISLGLSHPARLFIVKTLHDEGPKCVHELAKKMPIVQASVSHHLAKMRELGVIEVEEHKLFNQYTLLPSKLDELAKQYAVWFEQFQHR